jgi:hypothetical protein
MKKVRKLIDTPFAKLTVTTEDFRKGPDVVIEKDTSENKTSEAQLDAAKRWNEKNKEHKNYLTYRSMARSFIRKYATEDDLAELRAMIDIEEREIDDN